MTIRHAFVNPKADGPDATIVRPSDWNDDHVGGDIEAVLTEGNDAAGLGIDNIGPLTQPTLEVVGSDSTVDDLYNIVVPETYVDDSNYGRMFRAAFASMAANDFIYAFGLDDMRFRSALGEGDGSLTIESADYPSAVIYVGTDGIKAYPRAGGGAFLFVDAVNQMFGIFDKASAPVAQQTAASLSDVWDALKAYGLLDDPSAAPTISGLPPQWTDGGNGDVTAEAELTFVPFTAIAPDADTDAFDTTGPVTITQRDPNNNGLLTLQAINGSSDNDTDLFYIKGEPALGQPNLVVLTANGGLSVAETDVGEDGIELYSHGNDLILGNHGSSNEASLILDAVQGSPGFAIYAVGVTPAIARFTSAGALGFFGATPAAQQTIDAPNATPQQIANILIAYGLAVQSP